MDRVRETLRLRHTASAPKAYCGGSPLPRSGLRHPESCRPKPSKSSSRTSRPEGASARPPRTRRSRPSCSSTRRSSGRPSRRPPRSFAPSARSGSRSSSRTPRSPPSSSEWKAHPDAWPPYGSGLRLMGAPRSEGRRSRPLRSPSARQAAGPPSPLPLSSSAGHLGDAMRTTPTSARRSGGSPMPSTNPNAGRSGRQWLFRPGPTGGHRSDRHHLHETVLQRAVRGGRAASRPVSRHVLRHSFATHLLEARHPNHPGLPDTG
jgi:hypothetical protein